MSWKWITENEPATEVKYHAHDHTGFIIDLMAVVQSASTKEVSSRDLQPIGCIGLHFVTDIPLYHWLRFYL